MLHACMYASKGTVCLPFCHELANLDSERARAAGEAEMGAWCTEPRAADEEEAAGRAGSPCSHGGGEGGGRRRKAEDPPQS